MTFLPSSTVLPLTSRHRRRRLTHSHKMVQFGTFSAFFALCWTYSIFAMSFQQGYCEQHPQQRHRSYRFDCFLYFPRSLQLVDDFVHIGGPKLVGLSMSTWDHVRLAFGVDWSDHIRQFEPLFQNLDPQTRIG